MNCGVEKMIWSRADISALKKPSAPFDRGCLFGRRGPKNVAARLITFRCC
jgi:hypothetical protein